MFENEIILENLSKTMEIENQVLDGSLTLVKFQNIP